MNNWTQKFKELKVNESFESEDVFYDTIWQTHKRLKKRNTGKTWQVKKANEVVTVTRLS